MMIIIGVVMVNILSDLVSPVWLPDTVEKARKEKIYPLSDT